MLLALGVFAYGLILIGFFNRRKRRIHVPLMLTALVIDVALVLYIEISRGAIDAAKAKMGPLMIVHICFSVATLTLYGVQLATGIKMLRGKPSPIHRKTGLAFLVTRFGNLITSFMVMG